VLTGRTPPGFVRNIHTVSHKEITNVLIKQYDELINYLKKNGAYLNTIRPEYLLS